jgi:hypothetical protein
LVVGVGGLWWGGGEREEREEDDAAVWRRAEERDGAISDMLTNIKRKQKRKSQKSVP